jgi:signal transduction histidine kinase
VPTQVNCEIRHERTDLAEVIRECWKPLEEKANARGLIVEWKLDERDTLMTDRGKLRLVIQNILDNAVTYVNDQGQLSVATVGPGQRDGRDRQQHREQSALGGCRPRIRAILASRFVMPTTRMKKPAVGLDCPSARL